VPDLPETPVYDAAELQAKAKAWLDRIRARQEKFKEWETSAEEAEKIYRCGAASHINDPVPMFNILHSNVETIVPALYNSTAIPDVRPTVRDKADGRFAVLRKAADILEAALSAQVDDNALDKEIEATVMCAELAGRGVTRVRFDADVEVVQEPVMLVDETTGQELGIDYEEREVATNERVTFEAVPWRDVVIGPAKRWQDVPWVAFRLTVIQQDMDGFDQPMMDAQKAEDAFDKDRPKADDEFTVWEVWDRSARKVCFIREKGEMYLREDDDPLGLPGFFPIPEPVVPLSVTGSMIPVVPYLVYRDLAAEVDRATKRINAIMKGLKVRGGVVGNAENIARVADGDDWDLVPIQDVEGLAQTGGLEKAIVWWPIDKAVQVLAQLYQAREQAKQAIYEITGISDIVRGASDSGETATAQQIKTQWGSLRIRRRQRMIERHVRDLFVLSAHLICENFSDQRLAEVTGEELTPDVAEVLRGGLKQWLINVESDSTVRGDLTRKKGEMGEFLQGSAAYFQTMAPIVQQAPEAAPAVIQLYAAFGRMFSLGKTGEAAIEDMVQLAQKAASQPRPPSPEQQMQKAEMEMDARKMQHEQRMDMGKLQLDAARLEFDKAKAGAEIGLEATQQRPVMVGGNG
jgi:hypothetical protein